MSRSDERPQNLRYSWVGFENRGAASLMLRHVVPRGAEDRWDRGKRRGHSGSQASGADIAFRSRKFPIQL